MSNARSANAVRLEFAPGSLVRTNLSGAAFTGDWLWVAGDEACGLDRLRLLDPVGSEVLRFGEARDFPLAGLLDLPIEPDAQSEPCLVRQAQDGRRALRLKGNAQVNLLTQALADDPHFGPYMAIPSKDNGFDIEGLPVDGRRLLLGLRGPVLRGWSALLEIEVEARGDSLRLVPLDDSGTMVRKHFLQLDGLGVRDLHFSGDDLYILAGPTMVLNGEIRVFKWPAARQSLAAHQEPVRFEAALTESVSLPHGRDTNRAEAICDLPPALSGRYPSWLVLYDAPGADRRDGEHTVFGGLLRHD